MPGPDAPHRRAGLLSAGERVGRYVVEALLGEGGMGAVYRAHDEVLRRKVALKIVRSAQDDDAERGARRVLREARMAAALDHPNVVGLFDFGEHEGSAFLVMEHVVGVPLRSYVGAAEPGTLARVTWLVDVARALAAAHAAGLVHRDIKPENVMVRSDGVIKVLDFGIAAPVSEVRAALRIAGNQTGSATLATIEAGGISGTPPYMAPETFQRILASGDEPPASARGEAAVDQFAWGVVAYELLSGTRPWRDERSVERTMRSVCDDEPQPLGELAPDVPPEVAAAVHRALAKHPEDRFGSMVDLLAVLDPAKLTSLRPPPAASGFAPTLPATLSASHVEAETAKTRRASAAVAPVSGARRLALFLAGVVLAAVIGLVAIRWHRGAATASPGAPLRLMNSERLVLDTTCNEFPSFTPDAKALVFDGVSGPDSHVYEVDLATRHPRPLTTGEGWQYAAELSPDGKWLAYVTTSASGVQAMLLPRDGSSPPRRIGEGGVRPSWSPASDGLWTGKHAAPTRFDPRTGAAQRQLTPPPGMLVSRVRELQNGSIAALLMDDREIAQGLAFYEKGGGAPTVRLREGVEETLAAVPGEHAVIVSSTHVGQLPTLVRVPNAPGPTEPLAFAAGVSKGVAFSAKGDRMAWSDCNQRSAIVRVPDDLVEGTLDGPSLVPTQNWLELEPAAVRGTSLVVVLSGRRQNLGDPWVLDLSGKTPPRALQVGAGKLGAPAVSPDGRWVAFEGGREIFIEPLDGSAPPKRLTEGNDAAPTFSRDSRRVLFARANEQAGPSIFSVDVEGGAPTKVLGPGFDNPAASPVDDRLFVREVTDDGKATPRLYDPKTGTTSPLADGLEKQDWLGAQFSDDGTRAVVFSKLRAVEVELSERRVTRRIKSGAATFVAFVYTSLGLVANRLAWEGDLWVGDVAR